MNVQFSEYVTSSVFNLSLSKNMINALQAIYSGDRRYALGDSRFVGSANCLKNRGLMTHIMDRCDIKELANAEGFLYDGDWLISQPFNRIYTLTRAGELVCDLLIEAGLFDPTIEKAEPFKNPTKPRKPEVRV